MQNNKKDNDLLFLEEKILTEWKKSHFDKDAFTQIAYDALGLFDIENIDEFLFDYYSPDKESFPIHHVRGGFTDFPFCLVKNEHFIISMFVWTRKHTSIHDHYFTGAFKVLKGKSVNKEYSFEKEIEIEPWLFKGKLTQVNSKELSVGHRQRIKLRERFIHRVLHTETPTITLLIRDIRDSNEFHDYVSPNYSWHDKSPSPSTIKKTSLVERFYRDNSESKRDECNQVLSNEFDNISGHELFLSYFFYREGLNNIYFNEDFMLYLKNKFYWFNEFKETLEQHRKDI